MKNATEVAAVSYYKIISLSSNCCQ